MSRKESIAAREMTFEEALTKLEDVLCMLERSDCPLEEAMALFQEGMSLVKLGRKKLNDVENKVTILLKDTLEFIPFCDEGDNV